jgi:uncharacterized membrane protein
VKCSDALSPLSRQHHQGPFAALRLKRADAATAAEVRTMAWAELFRIEAICQWCVASALITLSIAGLATLRALRAGARTALG